MSEITLIGEGYRHTVKTIKMYSDSTPMVKIDDFEEMVAKSHTMLVRGGGMANIVTAMFLVDSIRQSGGRIHKLVLPYVPGARQDRINPTGDVLFTLDSVARMINERKFSRVIVLDPHSFETNRRINNIRVYPLAQVAALLRLPGGRAFDGIIAADKGGKDRAEQFAEALGLPIYYGGKTRDVSTGQLTGFTLDSIPKGHYLVADDICDGGGTFLGLAEKIREQGSTADLYVTHGIFSKGVSPLLGHYNTVYTTDSLAGSERGLYRATVLAVVEEMENY